MSEVAEQLDEVAGALVSAYRRAGLFAIVVRQIEGDCNNNVRSIHQQLGADVVATFLHKAADKIFEGPCEINYPRGTCK